MTVNADFLLYLVDKYVKGAANGIRIQDGTTTIKTLTPSCSSASTTSVAQATCTASDTSTDAYYFDRAYLLRSSYTIDNTTLSDVGYVTTTRTYKDGTQSLTVSITAEIRTG